MDSSKSNNKEIQLLEAVYALLQKLVLYKTSDQDTQALREIEQQINTLPHD